MMKDFPQSSSCSLASFICLSSILSLMPLSCSCSSRPLRMKCRPAFSGCLFLLQFSFLRCQIFNHGCKAFDAFFRDFILRVQLFAQFLLAFNMFAQFPVCPVEFPSVFLCRFMSGPVSMMLLPLSSPYFAFTSASSLWSFLLFVAEFKFVFPANIFCN